MSTKIRLARAGSKKRPYYHIVIADARAARDGKFIEKVGSYNPMLAKDHADRVKLTEDRLKHWLSVGAEPSDRVTLFLAKAGLLEMPKRRENPKQSLPKAKAQERTRLAIEAAEEAKQAEIEAKAAAKQAAEAPKEEVKASAPTEDVKAEASTEETSA